MNKDINLAKTKFIKRNGVKLQKKIKLNGISLKINPKLCDCSPNLYKSLEELIELSMELKKSNEDFKKKIIK
jgi:hypothetical protein